MAIIKTISDLLWGMPLIVLILLAGIIFTVGSKFFQIAHLKHMLIQNFVQAILYFHGILPPVKISVIENREKNNRE